MRTPSDPRRESTDRSAEHRAPASWLTVAVAIDRIPIVPKESQPAALAEAASLAEAALGPATLSMLARAELGDGPATTPLEILFLFVLYVQANDELSLTAAMLAVLSRIDHASPRDSGRFLALRARNARRLGDDDFSFDQFSEVRRVGRSLDDAELTARGELGLGSLAQARGNFPSVQRHSKAALRSATVARLPRLIHQAHFALLGESAKRKEFDDAISHAWAMLQSGGGVLSPAGADLQTLGQLLLDVGDDTGARKILTNVLRDEIAIQPALGAIGGLATAAARLGDHQTLDWAIRHLPEIRVTDAPPYELTQALLECAEALALAGRRGEAEPLRTETLALARAFRFHEFEIRAESLGDHKPEMPALRTTLRAPARSVLDHVAAMKSEALPRRLHLAAATP